MIDHVTIRVADIEAATAFYGRALALLSFRGEAYESDGFVEWADFSIAVESGERPATRNLHVGFFGETRPIVEAWWRAMISAGYEDAGPPGPCPAYGPDYYGAFLLDPSGSNGNAT
jgi:catechol 2,3-dioxygenase-like lactoylglutathione lyase family enzyme